jgi:RNA polymerase sigma factor (sigma-70 family)
MRSHTAQPDRASSNSPSVADSETAWIVTDAARGDQLAWNQLVERYSSLLWAVARAHGLTSVDAADVVQTSWLRLVEHLPQIRNPDAIGAWLATTARRECLRALRGTARCKPSEEIEVLAGADRGAVDTPLLTAERNATLWRAFNRLPARDQALLRLLTTEPALTYEEISAALGMPVGSIGPTRGRALERLRSELDGTGALGGIRLENGA